MEGKYVLCIQAFEMNDGTCVITQGKFYKVEKYRHKEFVITNDAGNRHSITDDWIGIVFAYPLTREICGNLPIPE